MNTKKMLAGVCAGAMALSLSAPAFATAIANPTEVDFTGKPAEGEIAVVMQTGKRNLYVNPYGLPYTLGFGEVFVSGGTTFDKTQDLAIKEPATSTEGFFIYTAVIQNNGDVALSVNVTMTTTEQGNARVVLEANKPTATNVDGQYMYGNLEIAPATIKTGNAIVTKTAAQAGPPAVAAEKEEQTDVKIVTPDWDSKQTVAIPAGSGTAGTAGTPSTDDTGIDLPAAETVSDSFGGRTTTPGVVAYRLAGTTIPMDKPNATVTTVEPWQEADVADVTVAFTFAPVATTPAP